MEATALIRRMLLGLFGTALGLGAAMVAAHADEVSGGVLASGVVIHDADDVLRRFVTIEDGVAWLTLPGGVRFELIRSTTDPAILNPGDGRFHGFDEAEVRSALARVRYPMIGIGAEVFILPYPRRAGLESCAGPGLILLAPGVRELSIGHQHAEFTHELGHVVQYARMPDADSLTWSRWRALRGVSDATTYSAGAVHADRPHEIFAEDFRALFGDALATAGTIENATLAQPAAVPGLDAFLVGIDASPGALQPSLGAWPNPSRDGVTLARAGGTASPLEIFDIGGRRLVTLRPSAAGGGWTWRWDGRDGRGQVTAAGTYLVREQGTAGPATRISLVH